MITLEPYEIKFIKDNKKMLSDLFKRRIDDLKDEIIICPKEERDVKVAMVVELKSWLLTIGIFSEQKAENKNKKPKEEFI